MDARVLLKSKSNNSSYNVLGVRSDNNKTRSSAQMDSATGLKKRGPFTTKENTSKPKFFVKRPPKPRPPRRKFVSKVLQILNKQTVGTQYSQKSQERLQLTEAKTKKRKGASAKSPKRKPSYEFNKEGNKGRELIILQSKKDLLQTPSENSCRIMQSESFAKDGELNMQRKLSEIINYNVRRSSIFNSEQRNQNGVIEIISNHAIDVTDEVEIIKNNVKESVKSFKNDENYFATDNNNMLTYFADVINDSPNVLNAKVESPESNLKETNEENPAPIQKVTINDMIEIDRYDDEIDQSSHTDFYVDANEFYDSDGTDVIEYNPSPMISQHYIPIPQFETAMQSSSFDYKPKSKAKKYRKTRANLKDKEREKRIIMNLMIEQLSMPTKEPKNLFEALKLMAKAKKKSTRFTESIGDIESEEECVNECQLWDQREQFSEFY